VGSFLPKTKGKNLAVTIDVFGHRATTRELDRYKLTTRDGLKRAVAATVLEIQTDARKAAPADSAFLRRSIKAYFTQGGIAGEVRVDAPYGPFVEWGTGPRGRRTSVGEDIPSWYTHGASVSMPPTAELARWATRKGLVPYAVARSIQKKGGVKAQPFIGPASRRGTKRFVRRIETVLRKQGR